MSLARSPVHLPGGHHKAGSGGPQTLCIEGVCRYPDHILISTKPSHLLTAETWAGDQGPSGKAPPQFLPQEAASGHFNQFHLSTVSLSWNQQDCGSGYYRMCCSTET
ncbi:hypothetical protein TNCT_633381 [Trichonephila clavata]|uniref:Uncharacterized protein n=1 Tax=Trichonephila clavata TaxID=2740835 RepID=A0A8X6LR99_TRICU|nr:hypothetical protein TNCT_633381 [Trichonephila clavata]